MMWWEILLVIRGYRRRNVLQYQLQRLTAWASLFCMGNKERKLPEDLTGKLYFDHYKQDDEPIDMPTAEEIAEIQAEIDAINKSNSKPPQ